ncbi:hypothetical protein SAMN06265222_1571, partial [Neorhodopirellula lusitana]
MQPSGEVERFDVVNLPSPPADRNRYPTEMNRIQLLFLALAFAGQSSAFADDPST